MLRQQLQQRGCRRTATRSTHPRCLRAAAFKLRPADGPDIVVEQARFVIGSGATADLQLQGANIAASHAELQQAKGKQQVFLRALQGESVFDRTHTWVDGEEVRARVSYVLAAGSTLAFGDEQASMVIEFEQPSNASNPLVELLMKGMAASANPDVQKELLL